MKSLKTLLAAMVIAGTGAAASASTMYATEVLATTDNGTWDAVSRSDPDAALGAPDCGGLAVSGCFYSLTLGGSIVLGFGDDFTSPTDGSIFEITLGNVAAYPESVAISTVLWDFGTGTYSVVESIGNVSNLDAQAGSAFATTITPFNALLLVDTSDASVSTDGFDLDGVGLTPVPLPATALLLLGGLGSIGLMRRRKKS